MKYTVTKSVVQVVGTIWMPPITCAYDYELSDYDLSNLVARKNGGDWREATDAWLSMNSGDFQSIEDFAASLEVDGETIDIEWANPDSECTYMDCMFPSEDD